MDDPRALRPSSLRSARAVCADLVRGFDGRSGARRGARLREHALVPAPEEAALPAAPVRLRPVWTVLYSLITLSAFRVWRRRGAGGRGKALGLWALQLGLNALWSPLFFGRRNPRA